MIIHIDRSSKEPIQDQIRRQVIKLVRDGLLAPGEKLPSVRELAKQLDVSRKTVHTAYENLSAENIIETRHGSGTYVTPLPSVVIGSNLGTRDEMETSIENQPPMRWEPYGFNSDFFLVPPSKSKAGKLIKFTMASPDPGLFPFARIKQVTTNMLWYPKEFFFDVGHPQGYLPMIDHLEKEMALNGIPMAETENDILLTGGFQRALTLVLDRLLKPGQKVAIESPTYTGIMNLLIAKGIEYVPIPVDDEGMDTDYLGTVLTRDNIKAVITVPTFHNPTGICMSTARREHLLRLAIRFRVPIIEDDWARWLGFDGPTPPPLKTLDAGGYVIYIGTFSKCLLPGLRIGWICAPSPFALTLVYAKLGAESSEAYFQQALLYEFIVRGHFIKHLRKTNKEYRKRRDTMCRVLDEHLPAGCSFHRPKGGFTIWVKLPPKVLSVPLLSMSRELGVDFLPAPFCLPSRKDTAALRLAYSRSSESEIEEGVKILCNLIRDCIDDPKLLDSGAKSWEEL
ncbi:PLP-dependent aminotransferase family protein [bacterium]|nr:PLP-dependent aminotransferase family protein [bacterium]